MSETEPLPATPRSASAAGNDDGPPPATFEAAMAELEELVRQMEAGKLPLEASLAAYRRGMFLVRHCQDRLAAAEQIVVIADSASPDGANDSGAA